MSDVDAPKPEEQELEMKVTTIGFKAEKDAALRSNARSAEDEFETYYGVQTGEGGIIKPPFESGRLERMETENNALGPCIDAMVTNVDGTGYSIETESGEAPTADEKERIKDVEAFFNEPWPGESMITTRSKLRWDEERTGNGYLEAIRNGNGDLIFLRHVEARSVRMVRLDNPIQVPVQVTRRGKTFTVGVNMRQRRFAQVIGNKLVYFKEFGVERELNKNTGKWQEKGTRGFPFKERATELIHFTIKKDNTTPYGVPRWVNQIPSVLGSREAEEHNLEFFGRGGIPPVLVLVSGGFVATKSAEALEEVLNASKNTLNAAVVEIHGQGSLDKESPVKVAIERFGGERQNDSMFESYDEKSEIRVRGSFRLPPLFVGKADSYSFATAFASYTVAEAQVFQPERREFDEVMNISIMPLIGGEGLKYRSMPLSVKDAQHQLKAIELAAKHGVISGSGLVESLNDVTNSGLTYDDESDLKTVAQAPQGEGGGMGAGAKALASTPVKPPTAKAEGDSGNMVYLVDLAERVAGQVTKGKSNRDQSVWGELMQEMIQLSSDDENAFKTILSTDLMGNITLDPNGAAEITGCTFAIMAANMFGDTAEEAVH